MANQLEVAVVHAIEVLLERGWSQRRVAGALGIDRGTVARYAHWAREPANPAKAEVELTAPFTLTTLRKSFGQNHANGGTPPRTLAKLLGHSDVSVTMEFYNRVTDVNERAAAQTMDRLLGPGDKRLVGT